MEPARELLFVDTAAGQSRIKPDNSWIKLDFDTSESTDDPTDGEQQDTTTTPTFRISDNDDSPVLDLPHPETYLGQAAGPDPSKPVIEETTVAEAVKDLPSDRVVVVTETSSDPVAETEDDVTMTQDSVGQSGGGDGVSLSERQVELGVKQYYAQEQIPWSPGTVQKIKQEISKSAVVCPPQDGTVVDSVKMDNTRVDDGQSEARLEPENIGSLSTSCNTQEIHTSRSCVELHLMGGLDRVGEGMTRSMEDVERVAEGVERSGDGAERPAKRRRPVSVYEKEEIPLPQGLVRKTTLEIEEKHR